MVAVGEVGVVVEGAGLSGWAGSRVTRMTIAVTIASRAARTTARMAVVRRLGDQDGRGERTVVAKPMSVPHGPGLVAVGVQAAGSG